MLNIHPLIMSGMGRNVDHTYVVTVIVTAIGTIGIGIFTNFPIMMGIGSFPNFPAKFIISALSLNSIYVNVYYTKLGFSPNATSGLTFGLGLITLGIAISFFNFYFNLFLYFFMFLV